MPRSKVRPNVSTYHEAVNFIINAIDGGLQLPLTKKQDKFSVKSLCYLAGMFGLDINAKIQEIYDHIQVTYNVPVEFITWVRVMQQETLGVTVPASYGTFTSNLESVNLYLSTLKSATLTDPLFHDEDGMLEDEETDPREHWQDHDYYHGEDGMLEDECQANSQLETMNPDDSADQVSDVIVESVVNPKPDWDLLAAKNPLAAAFVKSLLSTPDYEDDYETESDHHGPWEYEDTEGYEEDEY